MAGTWIYPNDPNPVPSGINSQNHYFQDLDKMKELAQSGAAKQQAGIMKEQSEKIVAQMKTLAKQMNGSHDASQVANYQKILNMSNQIKQLAEQWKYSAHDIYRFSTANSKQQFYTFQQTI